MAGRGRWKPGESGNPAGRKPGTKIKRTILREQIEACGPELIARIKAIAFNEEDSNAVTALLALLARLEAPLRPVSPSVEFEFDAKGNLASQIEQVLQAISEGKVPPDVGERIINGINHLAGARQFEDFEARIQALERKR